MKGNRTNYLLAFFGVLVVIGIFISDWTEREFTVVAIGSKNFTESVVLGEILARLAQDGDANFVKHKPHLGGTKVLWYALVNGEIDAYVEYEATLRQELFGGYDEKEMIKQLKDAGIKASEDLGFNNAYAIGMLEETAEYLNIKTIEDLASHKGLKFCLSEEFAIRRKDGWQGLRDSYGLPQSPEIATHEECYKQLGSNDIHVTDVYTTDAEVERLKVRVLTDNKKFLPENYHALILYREDLNHRAPKVIANFRKLIGQISDPLMRCLNAASASGDSKSKKTESSCQEKERQERERNPENFEPQINYPDPMDRYREHANNNGESPSGNPTQGKYTFDSKWVDVEAMKEVVKSFLSEKKLVRRGHDPDPNSSKLILRSTGEHLVLLMVALGLAIPAATLLSNLAQKNPKVRSIIPVFARIVWIIPPPAAIAILIPWSLLHPGAGVPLTILVIFVYSLAIIVRTSENGPAHSSEDQYDYPTFEGIRAAAVFGVGVAIIGALVHAGGFGGPIRAAVRFDQNELIWYGAIPAIILAFVMWGFFYFLEKCWGRGSRLTADIGKSKRTTHCAGKSIQ